MTKSAIVATKLRVKRGATRVLDGISCTIAEGTVTGLIGPSGTGKTTLMRAIVGVQRIESGELEVLGKPAGSRELRPKIGYVTQAPAVYTDLSIEQNLRYFATLVGANKAAVNTVLEQIQLTHHRKQLVATLSGGQKARVSLAVALLGDPDLLVLDEPTVGLDPLLRNELWDLFAQLATQGKTLVISSHVMDEAERCQDVLLIRDGSVLWNGAKDALLDATHTHKVGDAFVAMIKGGDS